MPDQRNLILAIALSVLIFLGFQLYIEYVATPVQQTERQTATETAPGAPGVALAPTPGTPEAAAFVGQAESREAALQLRPRVRIVTPRLSGSIALKGARIDDLTLLEYRETTEEGSSDIILLSPAESPAAEGKQRTSFLLPQDAAISTGPYFADFGWIAEAGEVAVPGPETLWQADRRELTPAAPLTLSWDNGQGLIFRQKIAIDENYMFTITRRVENSGTSGVILLANGRVKRTGTPAISGFYILHEGALGVFGGTLDEVDYDDMRDDGIISRQSTGGWIGITDKYWLTALVPDQAEPFTGRFVHTVSDDINRYQADFLRAARTVPAGGSIEVIDRLFAGPKVVELLDAYERDGIVRFDLAAAFRWLFFLAKPLFSLLLFINNLVGNFGIAILLVTVMIKIVFFPLANKSYRSMAAMKKLQPQVVKLKERYPNDKQKMQQEMMALYKAEGANPMMGCLPMLIQIPVFFALYEVLFVTIEMRHAPFFGWITDLSARDPSNIFNPFGIITFFEYPDFLHIGLWPLLMGFSMWLQFRLNPQPTDSIQAKIFMIMPIFFTFILAPFPAGLVIYWTWNNLLSIAQQWVIMKRHGIAHPAAST